MVGRSFLNSSSDNRALIIEHTTYIYKPAAALPIVAVLAALPMRQNSELRSVPRRSFKLQCSMSRRNWSHLFPPTAALQLAGGGRRHFCRGSFGIIKLLLYSTELIQCPEMTHYQAVAGAISVSTRMKPRIGMRCVARLKLASDVVT